VNHPPARELDGVDQILRNHPDITALVMQDLEAHVRGPGWVRQRMTAEQVLRAALLKQLNTWTYAELSFHLADSWTYRTFCGIGVLDEVSASEKIASIFEPHTEIIVKDRRDTHYGHKLTVSAGSSGLILDWVIEEIRKHIGPAAAAHEETWADCSGSRQRGYTQSRLQRSRVQCSCCMGDRTRTPDSGSGRA